MLTYVLFLHFNSKYTYNSFLFALGCHDIYHFHLNHTHFHSLEVYMTECRYKNTEAEGRMIFLVFPRYKTL